MTGDRSPLARLRRDLGTLESYAALIGVLVGAGIFKVTTDAFAATGPSVILGYLVLAPCVLATAIAYVVFLSTPLGERPGGEYTHVAEVFGSPRVAFVGAWLKVISFIGAGAYLAGALADYELELLRQVGWELPRDSVHLAFALANLAFFTFVHARSVLWFGRLQVAMCAVLGVSILVLVVPGLFAIELDNYRPFYTGGASGFFQSLVPLFFAYAGFEALAHTAGEVKDSTRRLPGIFVRGIVLTTILFLSISVVAFGVLPGAQLAESEAPMAAVGEIYLPVGASLLVTLGGILAVATSLNASLFVPARLALMLSADGLLPRGLATVHAVRGTPVVGLVLTALAAGALLVTGQLGLALNIAVVALVLLYMLHSIALLALPRMRPDLYREVSARVPRAVQVAAGLTSALTMGGLVYVRFADDVRRIGSSSLTERFDAGGLTSLELLLAWGLVGTLLALCARPRSSPA